MEFNNGIREQTNVLRGSTQSVKDASGSQEPKESPGAPFRIGEVLTDLPPDWQAPDPESPAGRILAAARRLFADQGFDRTSTRAISEEAGANQAMIHYYFGSKEKLYRKVIALEILAIFMSIAGRLTANPDGDEILIRLPLELMAELRDHPSRRRLIRREIGQGAGHAVEAIKAMGEFGPRGFRRIFSAMVEEGQRAGRLRGVASHAVLPFLLSVAYGAMLMEPMFRAVLGDGVDDDSIWNERQKGFGTLLRHGLLLEENP
jgi:AcrR family transcriptional regulator